MKSLVLDTNILLDLFVFHDDRAHPLKNALLSCEIKAFTCNENMEELADVISRPLFSLSEAQQNDIMLQWKSMSHHVEDADLRPAPWKCKDRDDQVFLDMAYLLQPAILISKDDALLQLAGKATKENILITKDYNAFLLQD